MSITKKGRHWATTESEKADYPEDSVVTANTSHNPRVQIVIEFMSANLDRRVSLTELAGVGSLSASHLSHLFKTETGLSPGEYLRRLRMEKARHLLATGLLSIKQIMAIVGYTNRSNFLRHFRRYFVLAPSEYRKHAYNSHRAQPNRKIV